MAWWVETAEFAPAGGLPAAALLLPLAAFCLPGFGDLSAASWGSLGEFRRTLGGMTLAASGLCRTERPGL